MADFRLGRLKFNWRGNWAPTTAYVIDDIVKFGANTYVCITNHTSVSNQSNWTSTDLAKWSLHTESVVSRGSWATSTYYSINDIVKFGANYYICTTSHTSTSSQSNWYSTDLSNWSIFVEGIEHKGDWQSGTYYKINDIVKYGNTQYRVVTGFSTTGFTTANVVEYIKGFEFEDSWSSLETYQPGDVVTYGGYTYIATTINTNKPPANNLLADWDVVTTGFTAVGTYSTLSDYKPGDVVQYGGYSYVAITTSYNSAPINTDNWSLVVKGINWAGTWSTFTSYKLGDAVRRNSNSYISVASSNAGNPPETDALGTYWNSLSAGAETNVLTTQGDIIYQSGSGPSRLPIGTDGQVLTVTSGGVPVWEDNNVTHPVYYVTEEGSDSNNGLNISRSFASLSHAVGIATGPATIYVKAGVYDEQLPIIVPEEVTVVGDNIRTTKIRPASGDSKIQVISLPYAPTTVSYGSTIINGAGTKVARVMNSNYLETVITIMPITGGSWTTSDTWENGGTDITINSVETRTNAQATMFMLSNKTMLKDLVMEGMTGFAAAGIVTTVSGNISGSLLTGSNFTPDLVGTIVSGTGVSAGTKVVNVSNSTTAEVSIVQSVGTTNLTFTALPSDINNATVKGIFVSLNPSSPITKSPYVSQCSAFSTGGVGAIVDGRVHRQFLDSGPTPSNKSIVFDSYTNIHDNGVGFWVTNNGSAEFVSCFTYYAYISYASTRGGRIRSLAGNSSWGTYGIVSSGYNSNEAFLSGQIEGLVLSYQPLTVTGSGFSVNERIIGDTSKALGYINSVQTSNSEIYYSLISAGPLGIGTGFAPNETIRGLTSGTTATLTNNTDANRGQKGFTLVLSGFSTSLQPGGSVEFVTGSGNGGIGNTVITGANPFTFVIQTVSYSGSVGLGTLFVSRGQLGTVAAAHTGGNLNLINYPIKTSTTLSGATDSSTTTFFVNSTSPFTINEFAQVDNEIVKITATSSVPSPNLTVIRGQEGAGIASAHGNGSTITAIGSSSVPGELWKDITSGVTQIRVRNASGFSTTGYLKIDSEFLKINYNYPDAFGRTIAILAEENPNVSYDGQTIKVRYLYSQVRLTGHDFLQIGTGGTSTTNWPSVPLVDPIPSREINEDYPGRIYYVSTDQNGNFRVGKYFRVNQATGSATLNSSAFDLSGLTSLRLGSIGAQLGAQINEFTTDATFAANSNEKVPTQAAVKAYVDAQIIANKTTKGYVFWASSI